MPDPRTPAYRPAPPVGARPRAETQAVHAVPRPDLDARRRRGKPESNALRMVIGIAGLASASALVTAMLPSIAPQPDAVTTAADQAAVDPTQQPDPSVIHVTRVVTLQPGQTLPPDAMANQAPAAATPAPKATPRPTPRVIIQTVTRQSGKKP